MAKNMYDRAALTTVNAFPGILKINWGSAAVHERETILARDQLIATGHFLAAGKYGCIRMLGTDDWHLIYTAKGSGRFKIGPGSLVTQRGDTIIIPPSVPHDYRSADGCELWETLWAHFLPWPHWIGILEGLPRYHELMSVHISERQSMKNIESALLVMHAYADSSNPNRELLAMNSLEKALLLFDGANPKPSHALMDSRVHAAMTFLQEHMREPITLSAIARVCSLSVSRLSHLFAREIGKSPLEYLEQQRIRRARDLLSHSALTVTQIAEKCGYSSQSYFTKRFTAAEKRSPREYRKHRRLE